MSRHNTIALLGMRCAGKTSVGRALAEELGRPFMDLDQALLMDARNAGVLADSAGELLASAGQLAFRAFEASALRRVLEPGQELVLATGGGTLEHASNRGWLARAARCVWLRASVETLQERMRSDKSLRPALDGSDAVLEIEALLARRSGAYAELSEFDLHTERKSPRALAQEIAARLA